MTARFAAFIVVKKLVSFKLTALNSQFHAYLIIYVGATKKKV